MGFLQSLFKALFAIFFKPPEESEEEKLQKEIKKLETEVHTVEAQISQATLDEENFKKELGENTHYKKHIYSDLPPFQDIANEIVTSDIQRKWKDQFGRTLSTSGCSSSKTFWCFGGYSNYQLPLDIIKQIINRSPIPLYNLPTGTKSCPDLGFQLTSEINISSYYAAFIGRVVTDTGKVRGCCWPTGSDKILFINLETKDIYTPNLDKEMPKELWI